MAKGISFNGRHSSQIDGITDVISYGFPLLPAMENKTVKLAGMDGEIDGGKTSSSRTFEVEFLIDGDTIEDYFQKTFGIEDWLNVSEAKQFIFDVLPDRYLMARPTAIVEPDRIAGYSKAVVEFTAFKPWFEGISLLTKTFVNATQLTYGGNKPTPPIFNITVNEALPYFRLSHTESGKFILINRAVALGDKILINVDTRSVMINGIDVRADMDIKSRYFMIEDDYTFDTNATAATMKVSYRERW
jgi:predicted phage tail component-like protein